MQEQDKQAFYQAMVAVSELYNRELSKPFLKMYFTALDDLSIEQVIDALNRHVRDTESGQYFPKPADIIRQLRGTRVDQERADKELAELEWSSVVGAVATLGSWRSYTPNNARTAAAIMAMGGWSRVCAMDHSNHRWMKKEFTDAFIATEGRAIEYLPKHCPGRIELDNDKNESSTGLSHIMGALDAYNKKNSESGLETQENIQPI